MRRTVSARSDAPVSEAWSLLAEPARWHEWSPHVRGAWRLGSPEVRPGALGAARLLWVVPVPAKVSAVSPGRSWTWRVGPLDLVHEVTPAPSGHGSRVAMTLDGPAPIVLAYTPVVAALTRRLARVAAGD